MGLSDAEDPLGHAAATLALGVFPLVVSLLIAVRISLRVRRRRIDETEHHILDLASRHDGTLTPIQLAHGTSLTLDEAKAELDRLHLAGHCQTDIDEAGNLLYLFPTVNG